jgi:flagellar biosynthetic protein FlhB
VPEEYGGEKTEQPTPTRRREARERGQVARSADLNTAVVLLAVFVTMNLMSGTIYSAMCQSFEAPIRAISSVELTEESVAFYTIQGLLFMAQLLVPIFAAVFALAIVSNIIQVGVVVTPQPLMPDLNRINPIKGFQRIFSARSLVRLGMSIGKLAIISAVLIATSYGEIKNLILLFDSSVQQITLYSAYIVFLLGIRASIVLLILAILDYGYQRWELERELRMTRQELRDELKRMEGDPKIRERRRSIQRQLAMQRMMANVPKAKVVITNPTELAVAIAYDEETMRAPTVVAKGADLIAARIREEAAKHNVPIVEKKPLAQALFKACEVGDEIPPALYQAVAEVLAYVYEITGRVPAAARA